MAYNQSKHVNAEMIRETKKEVYYEYHSILGGILGWWRKVSEAKLGEEIHVHINATLDEFDRLFINGKEIKFKD